jgi:hypothetical protein
MKRTLVAVVATLGLFATGCANVAGDTGPVSGGPAPHPAASDRLVVRISTSGGFVAPSTTITQLPQFSLMGDGSAITPGAIPEIYPGPAIAPLLSQQLTPDAVGAVLALAGSDGLTGPSRNYTDLGTVGVADMPTTTITIVADGTTHVFDFYALGGMSQGKPDQMSQAEYDARTKALDFEQKVGDLKWLPAGSKSASTPYVPTGVRIFVSPYRADPSLSEPEIAWPFGALSAFGAAASGADSASSLNEGGAPSRCGTVVGPDLATLLPLIGRANQLTPWKSRGKDYGLQFRPMLPDESGC